MQARKSAECLLNCSLDWYLTTTDDISEEVQLQHSVAGQGSGQEIFLFTTSRQDRTDGLTALTNSDSESGGGGGGCGGLRFIWS